MKKKSKKNTEKLCLCIAWYKPEQWSRLRDISEDRETLEESYEEWQINAEATLKNLTGQGILLRKATVDTEALLAWCNERGLPVDSKSRSEYAAWLARQQEEGN